ncbi:ferrous iron transport protein B [Desulfobacula phenolica]|uniref:Ferrous iron transport protein B n=1 Tax=Desulfobacula phenolica TaxID=90732 RepID=A0A1H2HB17_9BACT|nr:ferrous iron transport protein B [Desulfobacula phenolica]SDU29014.1 ferrous iron transport protein B [Desulfobacula phenolica]
MGTDKLLVSLAGQPNCGKSTVFNALTGAKQHVANYPGVTVDKMVGWYHCNGTRVEVVDLPGTYSMTSYSPEERVSRDFILHENPSVVINTMDASNLKRCLYLTFQLLEMEIPVILNLNMMDVAKSRGMAIDRAALSRQLGIPVVATSMKQGRGKKELIDAVQAVGNRKAPQTPVRVDYKEMESYLRDIRDLLKSGTDFEDVYPIRWMAIKLMEGDEEVRRLIREKVSRAEELLARVTLIREKFETDLEETAEMYVAQCRYMAAEAVCKPCLTMPATAKRPLSDKIDNVVCHKFLGPAVMVGVIWLLYYLSIVQGYNLTNYTWPWLAKIRNLAAAAMPDPGFIDIPLIRAFTLWLVDSVNALLNYIPIFFILFALIAMLEDSGYMPRMAFIMDRLFNRFGLHGQSTLPMVLGGIYVGGCAVPGVMSCRGIPDERSRLTTIFIIPMLNCLAKVPLYVLLINIYFAEHKAMAMFFISTISLLMVLPVSKLLTMTILRNKETAPFVMEMPPYHMPTIRGVLGRAIERVWMFIRKITTIVVALAVVIFILLQFPGISRESIDNYNVGKDKAIANFREKIADTSYEQALEGKNLMAMILFWESYKNKKVLTRGPEAGKVLKEKFKARNPVFFTIAQPGKDKVAKKVNRAFKKLVKARKKILREMRKERIDQSFLGRLGKAIVPATQWAGFNWRVNVALLSAFAAKESSVATLGALYEQDDAGESLENRMAKGEEGFTPLHALALMMFMVLYPPCLATSIAVKLLSGSVKWMMFSMTYQMLLGIIVSTLIFTGGSILGLTGLQAMVAFYGLALTITIIMGFIKPKSEHA